MVREIFVTGIERSGSTLIAKILALSGAFTGQVNKMMENTYLNGFLHSYYHKINADQKGQYPLPDVNHLKFSRFRDSIECSMMTHGYKWGVNPYMLKSSLLCQTWPVWHDQFPDARWIIVRRRTGDIVYSCIHTAFMMAFKNEDIRRQIGVNDEREGWLWWIHQHEQRFVEMIETGLNCMVVWPDRMVNDDYTQIQQMLEWVGLPFDEERIRKEIEPLLNKKKYGKDNSSRG
jgi:hypothetical protein